MRHRARWRILSMMSVPGALVVVALWAMQGRQARGQEQVLSGIGEGQVHSDNDYSTHPTRMYEACVMGSPCFGGQQLFWSRTVTLMHVNTR